MTPFGTGRPILADDEAQLDLVGLLPPGVLIALLVIALLAVVLGVVGGWLVFRRARRSSLGRRGRELAQSGLFSVGALALPPGRRELAAVGGRVNGARNDLVRQFHEATSAGRYVGDADSLVPRLVAEGDRLIAAIQRLTVAGNAAASGDQAIALTAEGEEYTTRVQPLLDALRSAASATSASAVTVNEIDDAAAGLRASGEAYRQFVSPPGATTPIRPARDRFAGDDAASR